MGGRLRGSGGLVDVNALGHRIDVPDDLRAGGEVVRPLVGHLDLSRRAIKIVECGSGLTDLRHGMSLARDS
jgi:hypothetical protein